MKIRVIGEIRGECNSYIPPQITQIAQIRNNEDS